MTPNPITIVHTELVGKAMELMARYDIRRLPVTKEGKLVGMLSEQDVLKYCLSILEREADR